MTMDTPRGQRPDQRLVRPVPGWSSWDSGPMVDAPTERLPRWTDGASANAASLGAVFNNGMAAQLRAAGACTFDQRQPARVVTKDRRETRHGLHLLLTLCTFGAWAFTGWPIAWAWNRFGPRRKTTTHYR